MVDVGPLSSAEVEPDPRLVGIVCCSGCRDCRRARAQRDQEIERYEQRQSLTPDDLVWLGYHERLARGDEGRR